MRRILYVLIRVPSHKHRLFQSCSPLLFAFMWQTCDTVSLNVKESLKCHALWGTEVRSVERFAVLLLNLHHRFVYVQFLIDHNWVVASEKMTHYLTFPYLFCTHGCAVHLAPGGRRRQPHKLHTMMYYRCEWSGDLLTFAPTMTKK